MRTIRIVWQRLLSLQGQTCDRCAATELALQQAVETLQQVLAPLQIQVEFHRQAMTLAQFNQELPTGSGSPSSRSRSGSVPVSAQAPVVRCVGMRRAARWSVATKVTTPSPRS